MNKVLSQNLKTLYQASNLSQKEFGERFGSNQKNIWAYLNNGTEPNGTFLLKLCQYYGFDINYLTTVKITVNTAGNITNLPKHSSRLKRLKKRAQDLKQEHKQFSERIAEELSSIITEFEDMERSLHR